MGNVTTYIVYIPSTNLEDPDTSVLTGAEVVMSPVILNHSEQPWRNPIPALMFEWLIAMQQATKDKPVVWSLFGFSRGAAWGLEIAAHLGLTFHSVLLVAPFFIPRLSAEEQQGIGARLARLKQNILMVWGERDPWQPCEILKRISQAGSFSFVPGIGHEESRRYCIDTFFKRLVV